MPYKIATTVKQAAWECRWARAGRRLNVDPEQGHPENLWICVRPTAHGTRRVVSEGECDSCEHWRAPDDDVTQS
ncbi:MAG: hypothetical protein ABL993_03970 [Vicinamibacterales bacterium]